MGQIVSLGRNVLAMARKASAEKPRLTEEEHLLRCSEAAEMKARGMSFRSIGEAQGCSHATAHERYLKWLRLQSTLREVDNVRGALQQRLEWIYSQHVAQYATALKHPVLGRVPQAGEDPGLPELPMPAKVRMVLGCLEEMRKDVELEARILGAMQETTLNFGPGAGGVNFAHMEMKVPDDPERRREYAQHVRAAARLAGESTGV